MQLSTQRTISGICVSRTVTCETKTITIAAMMVFQASQGKKNSRRNMRRTKRSLKYHPTKQKSPRTKSLWLLRHPTRQRRRYPRVRSKNLDPRQGQRKRNRARAKIKVPCWCKIRNDHSQTAKALRRKTMMTMNLRVTSSMVISPTPSSATIQRMLLKSTTRTARIRSRRSQLCQAIKIFRRSRNH